MKSVVTSAALVGAGGFAGALLRYGLAGLVHRQLPLTTFPHGTLAVNLLGCLGIGGFAGLVETRQLFGPELRTFALIGLPGDLEGFGTHSRLHTSKILRLSSDLPIVVEIVEIADTEDKIEAFLPAIDEAIGEDLVTLEKVEVRFCRVGGPHNRESARGAAPAQCPARPASTSEEEQPMLRSAASVAPVVIVVGAAGIATVHGHLPLGPAVLAMAVVPVAALLIARRPLSSAVPDLVFGSIDTGLLAIPAVWGGITFGIAGAIAGTVVGDAITDGVAGFFEGHIAAWLRARGFGESREAVVTSLGKMAGCLLGAGLVLTAAWLIGIDLHAAGRGGG